MIDSKAGIKDGYYGMWRQITTSNGTMKVFDHLGKEVTIEDIKENIENDDVTLRLSFDYQGRTKYIVISREDLADPASAKAWSRKGVMVTKKSFDCLVETLLQQEEEIENSQTGVTNVYDHLGWIQLPAYDDTGNFTGYDLCFRAHKLIGAQEAQYVGPFDVTPRGDSVQWRSMVKSNVIPYPALQLVLVAALSSVVNGLIAPETNGENPIVHLCYPSGRGKSTAAMVATSTIGRPFDGVITETDDHDTPVDKQSLYQSWGSTIKAMVTTNAGNRGAVTVLNELGKNTSTDLTNAVFNLSEGSDLKRLTPTLQTRISQRYTTTFISTGETSLLDRCKDKLEGLSIRIMEVSKPLTVDADHANRIKETCRQHCGHAAWRLAKFIIMRGGLGFVLPIYKDWVSKLRKLMPETPSRDRFIEKFAALFMTTAYIARKALKLPLDMDSLLNFLIEYDAENGESRNTSASAYEVIVEQLRINSNKFYIRDDGRPSHTANSNIVATPIADSWGRCVNKLEELDGQYIVQEFQVRPSVLEKLLKSNGFENIKTVLEEWDKHGWLDGESNGQSKKKLKKRLKVDPFGEGKEPVYVIRVFADEEEAEAIRAEQAERARKAQRRPLPRQSTIKLLEKEDDDDDASA